MSKPKLHHHRFRSGRIIITCDPYNNRTSAYHIDTIDHLWNCKKCLKKLLKEKLLNYEHQLLSYTGEKLQKDPSDVSSN